MQRLILALLSLLACANAQICSDVFAIDHCCKCTNCSDAPYSSLTGIIGTSTPSFDITPTIAPLPRTNGGLGGSIAAYGDHVAMADPPGVYVAQSLGNLASIARPTMAQVYFRAGKQSDGLYSLATSDTLLVVGNPSASCVMLFVRTSSPPWTLAANLSNPEAQAETSIQFAVSVDVNEPTSTMAVGDAGHASGRGRAYVYSTNFPRVIDTLEPDYTSMDENADVGNAACGTSVRMGPSWVALGCPGMDTTGNVLMFQLDATIGRWNLMQTISQPNPNAVYSEFGSSVAIDETSGLLVVGYGYRPAQVELYTLVSGNWTWTTSLAGTGLDPSTSQYGTSISIAGTRIAVADPAYLVSGSARGAVFTFESSEPCQVFQDAPLSFNTFLGQSTGFFGIPHGRLFAIGAPGANGGDGDVEYFDLDRTTQCAGCDGVVNSCAVEDACGVCGGNGQECAGCDGVSNSEKKLDVCGVCGGNNTTCLWTAPAVSFNESCGLIVQYVFSHVPSNETVHWITVGSPSAGGTAWFTDATNGVLSYQPPTLQTIETGSETFRVKCTDGLGRNASGLVTVQFTSCRGCDGVIDSGKTVDRCGVCGGDGMSCLDCKGTVFGPYVNDACGKCTLPSAANTTCLWVNFVPQHVNVSCGHTLTLTPTSGIVWGPTPPSSSSRHLLWSILTKPKHGKASIGQTNAKFTYSQSVSPAINASAVPDNVTLSVSDKYSNKVYATVLVSIVPCVPGSTNANQVAAPTQDLSIFGTSNRTSTWIIIGICIVVASVIFCLCALYVYQSARRF